MMNDLIQINNEKDIEYFLIQCDNFHDSCIFEIYYKSGAYVDENLSMCPVNSVNTLTIRFHSQNKKCRKFDVVFIDLIHLNFAPIASGYSCEIFRGKLIQRRGVYYWSPNYEFDPDDTAYSLNTKLTWVCCKKIKWRIYDEEIRENI